MHLNVDLNISSKLVHGRLGPGVGYDQHAFDVDQHRLVCVPPGPCGQELVCCSNLSRVPHDQQGSEIECGQQFPLPYLGSQPVIQLHLPTVAIMDILSSSLVVLHTTCSTCI